MGCYARETGCGSADGEGTGSALVQLFEWDTGP